MFPYAVYIFSFIIHYMTQTDGRNDEDTRTQHKVFWSSRPYHSPKIAAEKCPGGMKIESHSFQNYILTLPHMGDFEQNHTWGGALFEYVLLMLKRWNFQRWCIIAKLGCIQESRTVMSIFWELWRQKWLTQ